MPIVIRIVEGGAGEQVLSFDSSPIRIGRNRANEIVIDRPFVSQRHAQIDVRGVAIFVTDVGSTNGTSINGQRLHPRAPMQLTSTTDVVQIGSLQITVTFEEELRTAVKPAKPLSIKDTRALQVQIFENQHAEPRLLTFTSSPIRIGRNKLNEIVFEQAFVSQWHALVRYSGGVVQVMDLGSTNGTVVNGERLQSRTPTDLSSLDEAVQIGSIQLRFAFSAPATVSMTVPLEEVNSEDTALFFDAAKWLCLVQGDTALERRKHIPVGPAMDRVKLLLETFGRSYVELRNGFEQFGKEMGVNTTTENTPLHAVQGSQELLGYLLEWEASEGRIEELRRAYTDLALHQVALLNGVMAGVRELLHELSPGGDRWRPFRTGDMEKKRQELLEEDRFSRVVFGKAFAKAYFAVTGGKPEGEK